jgi:hypothetical protein
MGIGAGDESDTDLKTPGKILFLRLIESPEQSAAAIGAINADGTIDVTTLGAKRFALELDPIVTFEHLRDDRRAVVEFVTECAKKRHHIAIDRSDSRPEILRHLGHLPECKFSQKEPLLPLFYRKIANEVRRL